jgi:hypothetical protein
MQEDERPDGRTTHMQTSSRTKVVASLAVLDLARQVASAWAARERARREQVGFGAGLRADTRRLAQDARHHVSDELSRWEVERGWPPIHRRARASDRARAWVPVAAIVVLGGVAVAVVAHVLVGREEHGEVDPEHDGRVAGAVRASAHAIDAGVSKVVEGGSGAAAGTAAAIAAGSSAVRAATVERARSELDARVVAPARRKAIVYGSLGVVALTVYVIVIAVVVQLVVGALG